MGITAVHTLQSASRQSVASFRHLCPWSGDQLCSAFSWARPRISSRCRFAPPSATRKKIAGRRELSASPLRKASVRRLEANQISFSARVRGSLSSLVHTERDWSKLGETVTKVEPLPER